MTSALLPKITSPADLHQLTDEQLAQLTQEMRDELVRVLSIRPAHFASNLGVVELCLALHLTFDFTRDHLIWDTGHQIYPHKLITGRYPRFDTIRQRGGLMGYPNPDESPHDLFMTGHAGCSVSCALGLKVADDLLDSMRNAECGMRKEAGGSDSPHSAFRIPHSEERHSVAVIGDGALPSGIVFEALNNAGGLRKNLLVVLNDNEMSICPRVGSLAASLDRARLSGFYQDSKRTIRDFLASIPLVGPMAKQAAEQLKDGVKALLTGGMLFDELGFRYIGPIDGHDLPTLRRWLRDVKDQQGPVLLHVLTKKGQGVPQACADPVTYHTPPVFEQVGPDRSILSLRRGGSKGYTDTVSAAIHAALQADPRVSVITAAMCQGNKLEKVRTEFPERFFDVGICESHAVAFAAGLAKAGGRPIVDIYSTFLQRSFDQIFQEVALQNLPVVFTLDRAGLVGSDGPTHHGTYDLAYLRVFPNLVVMAPGDSKDVAPMLDFALGHDAPVSIRYPKANLETIDREAQPIELGQAEILEWETDGMFLACGTLVGSCLRAAERLRTEHGLRVGVVNARFVKPLDKTTALKAIEECGFVLTVEEGCLMGGFGSAVLEAASDAGLSTAHVRRLGLPDRFVLHAERDEQLAEVGLDVDGITRAAVELARPAGLPAILAENGQACAT